MGDAGFYRGTTAEQDGRFSDKEKKLLKQMKFESCLDNKVDLQHVNIDVVKPWITGKLNAILGIEDDVVTEYVFTQLEEKSLNPKIMQINLTGFLNARRAREFMGELWQLLLEAQTSEDGIPASLISKKMNELKAQSSGSRREVPMNKATETDWKNRYQALTGGRYGKAGPNYNSEPGAGDSLREPESPSDRRWRREPTPDYLPIPRRKRGDEETEERSDRDRHRDRDSHRSSRRNRSRSRSRERRRRRSSSPSERRFTEARQPRRSPSYDDERPPSRDQPKERKRHDSDDSDHERKKRKHKKSKKEKKSKKDHD